MHVESDEAKRNFKIVKYMNKDRNSSGPSYNTDTRSNACCCLSRQQVYHLSC